MGRSDGLRVATAAALAAAALAGGAARAADVVVVPASRDNTLIETAGPSRSNGAGPFVFAGRVSLEEESIRRGLLAFDVTDHVPRGSRVLRAALVLHVDRTGSSPGAVSLHRVLASWGEGTSSSRGGRGAPATPGDATWLHTFFDAAFWGAPGGDFRPEASAVGRDAQGGFVVFGSTDAMIHDVQRWLDRPGEAHGWLLRGDESRPGTVTAYDSRESSEEGLQPRLVLQVSRRGRGKTGDGQDFEALLERLMREAAAPRDREAAVH